MAMAMLRLPGAIVFFVLLATAGVRADTRHTQFVVRATVPAQATVEALEQPSHLWLSTDDIARGFKDVPARYLVASNGSRGWLLRLSPRLGVTRRIEVRGLPGEVVVRDDSVEVYRPRTRGPQDLALDYRFVLASDARPGRYELPVHLSATPL
jgi:hypothetical protein